MEQTDAVKSLSAMAHDGRLGLLRQLIQAGPKGLGAGELARSAGIGASTASAQLLVLTNAGLIAPDRRGREVVYTARFDRLRDLMGFLMVDCCAKRADICLPVAKAVQA